MGSERFLNLAEKRVSKALKDLELIGNLGNRSNYEYTADEVSQIFKALDEAMKNCKSKFSPSDGQNAREPGFKFKSYSAPK